MITWNRKIYMDTEVAKKPYKYRRLVERKKILRNFYCITLPADERNLMDIYSSRELWFKYRRIMGLEIIGMAAYKESAGELAAKIVMDVLKEYGEINSKNLKAYFSK